MMATDNQLINSDVTLNVTTLGDYDIILGMPWLRHHSGLVGAAGPSLLLTSPQPASSSPLTHSSPVLCSPTTLDTSV